MIPKESPNKVTDKNKILAPSDVILKNERRNTERGCLFIDAK
jgi:hypothetical protein